jgi:hypothetical protein
MFLPTSIVFAVVMTANHKNKTTDAVEIPPRVVTAKITPEFCRLPKSGELCPFTGLTRSYLNSLILPGEANNFKPPVRSVALRHEGNVRGVRLIVFSSLMQHLRNQCGESETTPAVAPARPCRSAKRARK